MHIVVTIPEVTPQIEVAGNGGLGEVGLDGTTGLGSGSEPVNRRGAMTAEKELA